jgi:hypothetical protein
MLTTEQFASRLIAAHVLSPGRTTTSVSMVQTKVTALSTDGVLDGVD